MKRGLVLSLSALALAVIGSAAHAQSTIDVSLNLRYTDPAAPSEGGTWQLVAKTNNAFGIAALNAYISNLTNTANIRYGNGNGALPQGDAANLAAAALIGAELDDGNIPFVTAVTGGHNVLYGQDTANGPIVQGVGKGAGTPGAILDPLKNPLWDNAALLANGTFGASRPDFISVGTTPVNSTDGNSLASGSTTPPLNNSPDANIGLLRVRGDSLNTLGLETPAGAGLRAGDLDRDGAVGAADLAVLGSNWAPSATNKTWDQGDFDNDGAVGAADLAMLGSSWNPSGSLFIPPAIAAVPEPSALALLTVSAIGFLSARRRRTV